VSLRTGARKYLQCYVSQFVLQSAKRRTGHHVLHRFKVGNSILFELFVQARHLHQPAHVIGEEVVVAHPRCELGPLIAFAAINRHAVLCEDVLAVLELFHQLVRHLREIAALDEIVGLEEYLAQSRLADGIVLEIELVEAVEDAIVCVHVQSIHCQVVGCQSDALEHFLQREVFVVTEYHHFLK
jgi:hypothetical protein